MADFSALIAQIEAYVKQNGNNEITGNGLQSILVGMVNALGTVAITALQGDLADEVTARQNADGTLQQGINTERQQRQDADGAINAKIPAEASSSNKLADKAFVTGLTTALQNAVNAIKADIENGYVYAGIATPSGTPVSGKVYYLARQAGTYTNFGGLTLTEGVNILKYNGTAWSQEQLISIADIRKNPLIGYYECDTAGATAAKTVAATGYVLPATGGSVKIKMANRNTAANATLNINSTGAKPLYYNGQRAGVGNTWDTNEVIEVYYDGTNYQAHNVAGSNDDGVFDVSKWNLTNGQPTVYDDLADALGENGEHVPLQYRDGGMQIKFICRNVQSSDNNYVHFTYMLQYENTTAGNTAFLNTDNWQGVDDEPTAGSHNLVESGGMVDSSLFGKINYNLKWTKIEKTAGLYNYPLLSNIVGNTYFYVYLKSNDVPSLLGVTFKNGITTTLQSDVIKLENVDISGGTLYKIMLRPQNVDINYAALYTDIAWEGEMCIFQESEMDKNTVIRNSIYPVFKSIEKSESLTCIVPYKEVTGYAGSGYIPFTGLNIKAGDKLIFVLNSPNDNRNVEISLWDGDVKKETISLYNTSNIPFNVIRYTAEYDADGVGYFSNSTTPTGIIVYREKADKEDVVLYDGNVTLAASTLTKLDLNEIVPKNQRCVLVIQGDVTSSTLMVGVEDSQGNKELPDIIDVGNYNLHVGKECELVSSIDFDRLRVFSNTSITINVRLYYIKENNNDISLKHLESSNNSVSKDFSNLVALTPYKEFQLQSRAIPIIENGLSINEGDELIFVVDSKPDDRRILFTLMDGNNAVAIDFIGCNTMDGGTQVLHVKAPASGNAIRAYTESSQIFGLQILKTGVTEKMQFVAQNLSFSTASGVKNLSTGLNIKAGDVLHFFVKSSNTTPLIYFGLKDSTETVSADFLKIENTDLSNEVEYTVTMQGYGSILYVYSTAINTIGVRIFKEKNINEEVNVGKFFNPPSSLFLMADFNWPLSLRINASNDGKRWKLLKEFTDLQYRDPWIGKYNGEYYFVGTPDNSGSGGWSGSMTLTIYKSTDLNTWSQYCQITLSQSSLWSGYDDASIVWAPEIKWFDGVPYLLCALYFPKTGGGGYRVQPYIYQLASDLQSVTNGQRLAGTNIDDTYDFDVDITKIGNYYYEISNGHRGRCINIGRSSTLYGNYDTYAYIELQNGGNDLYWEGGTIVPVEEKIYIFVTQKYPGWVSGQPKALGLYVCDNNFKLLEYHKMTGGAMPSEDDMILAEHPFVFMADINDLFTILNL